MFPHEKRKRPGMIPVAKAGIEPDECISGRVDNETGERYVFIQATKSYGVTKKLRYL